MGYMGLDKYTDSDSAADLAYDVVNTIAEALDAGLKEKGDSCNTNGVVNVALAFEAFIMPVAKEYKNNDKLKSVIIKTHKLLASYVEKAEAKSIDSWGGESNKDMHIKAYKRMLNKLQKFLEQ